MKTLIYQIEFFTFWHAGSGLSGGAYADQMVNKGRNELPFIPGKTLKGLLRDAAMTINEYDSDTVKQEFIRNVFGEVPTPEKINNEQFTTEGFAFFSNAQLSTNLAQRIGTAEKSFSKHLYRVLASTKIDANGLAEDHSLRQLEVAIPLKLYAAIEQFPDNEAYREQMGHCMAGVKRMGLNRSRGLGRCNFTILNEDQ